MISNQRERAWLVVGHKDKGTVIVRHRCVGSSLRWVAFCFQPFCPDSLTPGQSRLVKRRNACHARPSYTRPVRKAPSTSRRGSREGSRGPSADGAPIEGWVERGR